MRLMISAALLALVLTGCAGGDKEPASPGASSEPEAAPEPADPGEAVQAWVDAYAAGDAAAACALQTDAYTEADLADSAAEGTIEEGASCEDGVALAAELLESFGIDMSTAEVEVVSEDADVAEVTVTIDGSPETYGLVLTDGEWLIDSEG